MSALTAALYQALQKDLEPHLNSYQILTSETGAKLWPDATPREAQSFALLGSLFKKYNEEDKPSQAASNTALKKFLDANVRCQEWVEPGSTWDQELLNGVRSELWNFWNAYGYDLVSDYGSIHAAGRVGPGASRGARGDDMYTKVYDSSLSATSESLLFVWQRLAAQDPRWKSAEETRCSRYGSRLVQGNKLSFVNKNVTVARCISTEPTVNMWFQLGLGEILCSRIRQRYGVDFTAGALNGCQPEVNGTLARVGSESGRFATIDLASASDSISMGMAKSVLPPNMFDWLVRFRSPTVELPDRSVVKLEMVSTMGNGYTFPLQTLIFCAVVVTAYRDLGIKPQGFGPAEGRNYGVFGDDIIVETGAARRVYHLLSLLGFTVNADKSFVEGPFRESCGYDWYQGSWCRGVYIKRLRSTQDYCVAINALNKWSAITGIRVPNLVSALVDNSPGKLLLVPPDEPDDAGVHTTLAHYKANAGRAVTLSHGIVAYTCYRARAQRLLFLESGAIVALFKTQKGNKPPKRTLNESGAMLAFLAGYIRGYRISLRQRRMQYTTKPMVTSLWETVGPHCRRLGVGWLQLRAAIDDNLPSSMRRG